MKKLFNKKKLAVLLSVSMILTMFPMTASAEEVVQYTTVTTETPADDVVGKDIHDVVDVKESEPETEAVEESESESENESQDETETQTEVDTQTETQTEETENETQEPVTETENSPEQETEENAEVNDAETTASDSDAKENEEEEIDEKALESERKKAMTEEELAEAYPELSEIASDEDVIVTMKAAAGVFPAGGELVIEKVVDETTLEDIDEILEDKRDEEKSRTSFTYDVRIEVNGKEVQPDTDYGNPAVTFTFREKIEGAESVEVYHIEDTDKNADAEEAENAAETETADDEDTEDEIAESNDNSLVLVETITPEVREPIKAEDDEDEEASEETADTTTVKGVDFEATAFSFYIIDITTDAKMEVDIWYDGEGADAEGKFNVPIVDIIDEVNKAITDPAKKIPTDVLIKETALGEVNSTDGITMDVLASAGNGRFEEKQQTEIRILATAPSSDYKFGHSGRLDLKFSNGQTLKIYVTYCGTCVPLNLTVGTEQVGGQLSAVPYRFTGYGKKDDVWQFIPESESASDMYDGATGSISGTLYLRGTDSTASNVIEGLYEYNGTYVGGVISVNNIASDSVAMKKIQNLTIVVENLPGISSEDANYVKIAGDASASDFVDGINVRDDGSDKTKVNIELTENSSLEIADDKGYGINLASDSDLTITGNGTLLISDSINSGIYAGNISIGREGKTGYSTEPVITVNSNAKYYATDTEAHASIAAIHAVNDIEIAGGDVTVVTGNAAVNIASTSEVIYGNRNVGILSDNGDIDILGGNTGVSIGKSRNGLSAGVLTLGNDKNINIGYIESEPAAEVTIYKIGEILTEKNDVYLDRKAVGIYAPDGSIAVKANGSNKPDVYVGDVVASIYRATGSSSAYAAGIAAMSLTNEGNIYIGALKESTASDAGLVNAQIIASIEHNAGIKNSVEATARAIGIDTFPEKAHSNDYALVNKGSITVWGVDASASNIVKRNADVSIDATALACGIATYGLKNEAGTITIASWVNASAAANARASSSVAGHGKATANSTGIFSKGNILVSGGTVTADAGDTLIAATSSSASNVMSYGIYTEGNELTVNGAKLNAKSSDLSYESGNSIAIRMATISDTDVKKLSVVNAGIVNAIGGNVHNGYSNGIVIRNGNSNPAVVTVDSKSKLRAKSADIDGDGDFASTGFYIETGAGATINVDGESEFEAISGNATLATDVNSKLILAGLRINNYKKSEYERYIGINVDGNSDFTAKAGCSSGSNTAPSNAKESYGALLNSEKDGNYIYANDWSTLRFIVDDIDSTGDVTALSMISEDSTNHSYLYADNSSDIYARTFDSEGDNTAINMYSEKGAVRMSAGNSTIIAYTEDSFNNNCAIKMKGADGFTSYIDNEDGLIIAYTETAGDSTQNVYGENSGIVLDAKTGFIYGGDSSIFDVSLGSGSDVSGRVVTGIKTFADSKDAFVNYGDTATPESQFLTATFIEAAKKYDFALTLTEESVLDIETGSAESTSSDAVVNGILVAKESEYASIKVLTDSNADIKIGSAVASTGNAYSSGIYTKCTDIEKAVYVRNGELNVSADYASSSLAGKDAISCGICARYGGVEADSDVSCDYGATPSILAKSDSSDTSKSSYGIYAFALNIDNALVESYSGKASSDSDGVYICGTEATKKSDQTLYYVFGLQNSAKLVAESVHNGNHSHGLHLPTSSNRQMTVKGRSSFKAYDNNNGNKEGQALNVTLDFLNYDPLIEHGNSPDDLSTIAVNRANSHLLTNEPYAYIKADQMYQLWIDGTQVSDTNMDNINGITIGGVPAASYDPDTNTLYLNDYEKNEGTIKSRISGVTGLKPFNAGIYLGESTLNEDFTIVVSGTNYIDLQTSDAEERVYGIAAYDSNIIIRGSGSNAELNIDSSKVTGSKAKSNIGIAAGTDTAKNITFENLKEVYIITGDASEVSEGVRAANVNLNKAGIMAGSGDAENTFGIHAVSGSIVATDSVIWVNAATATNGASYGVYAYKTISCEGSASRSCGIIAGSGNAKNESIAIYPNNADSVEYPLTLKNVQIDAEARDSLASRSAGIYIGKGKNLNLTNTYVIAKAGDAPYSTGVLVENDLTLDNTEFWIETGDASISNAGIMVYGSISGKDVSWDVDAGDGKTGSAYGVFANDYICINNANHGLLKTSAGDAKYTSAAIFTNGATEASDSTLEAVKLASKSLVFVNAYITADNKASDANSSYGMYTKANGIGLYNSGLDATVQGGQNSVFGVYSPNKFIFISDPYQSNLNVTIREASCSHAEAVYAVDNIYIYGAGANINADINNPGGAADYAGGIVSNKTVALTYVDGEINSISGNIISSGIYADTGIVALGSCSDLKLKAAGNGKYAYGIIASNSTVEITGSTVYAEAGNAASYSDGIFAEGQLNATDSDISGVSSATNKPESSTGIYVSKGTLYPGKLNAVNTSVRATSSDATDTSYGVYTADEFVSVAYSNPTDIVINNIASGSNYAYGIYSKNKNILIDNAKIEINKDTDSSNYATSSAGIYAKEDIRFENVASGSVVKAVNTKGKSYGIYSPEGEVVMNNSHVDAYGGDAHGSCDKSAGIYVESEGFTASASVIGATGGKTDARKNVGTSYGIYSYKNIELNDSALAAESAVALSSYAIYTKGTTGIQATDSDISAVTGAVSKEAYGIFTKGKFASVTAENASKSDLLVMVRASGNASGNIDGIYAAKDVSITNAGVDISVIALEDTSANNSYGIFSGGAISLYGVEGRDSAKNTNAIYGLAGQTTPPGASVPNASVTNASIIFVIATNSSAQDELATIKAIDSQNNSMGIYAVDEINIVESKFNIISGEGIKSHGIQTKKSGILASKSVIKMSVGEASDYSRVIVASSSIDVKDSTIEASSSGAKEVEGLYTVNESINVVDSNILLNVGDASYSNSYGMLAAKTITIIGSASDTRKTVSAKAGKALNNSVGIYAKNAEGATWPIVISNINVEADSDGSEEKYSYGIYVDKGKSLKISSASVAARTGSAETYSTGVRVDGDIILNDVDFNIACGNAGKSSAGLFSAKGMITGTNVSGDISSGEGTLSNSYGIYANSDILLSNSTSSTLSVNSTTARVISDGLHAENGKIELNGINLSAAAGTASRSDAIWACTDVFATSSVISVESGSAYTSSGIISANGRVKGYDTSVIATLSNMMTGSRTAGIEAYKRITFIGSDSNGTDIINIYGEKSGTVNGLYTDGHESAHDGTINLIGMDVDIDVAGVVTNGIYTANGNVIDKDSDINIEAGSDEYSTSNVYGIYAQNNFLATSDNASSNNAIAIVTKASSSNNFAVGIKAENDVNINGGKLTVNGAAIRMAQLGSAKYTAGIAAGNDVSIIGVSGDNDIGYANNAGLVSSIEADVMSTGIFADRGNIYIDSSRMAAIGIKGGYAAYGIKASSSDVILNNGAGVVVMSGEAGSKSNAIWAYGNVIASSSAAVIIASNADQAGGAIAANGYVRIEDTPVEVEIRGAVGEYATGIYADDNVVVKNSESIGKKDLEITIDSTSDAENTFGIFTNGRELNNYGGAISLVGMDVDIDATGRNIAGIKAATGNVADINSDLEIITNATASDYAIGVSVENGNFVAKTTDSNAKVSTLKIMTKAVGIDNVCGIQTGKDVKITNEKLIINNNSNNTISKAFYANGYSYGIYASGKAEFTSVASGSVVRAINTKDKSAGIVASEVFVTDSDMEAYAGNRKGGYISDTWGIVSTDNNIVINNSRLKAAGGEACKDTILATGTSVGLGAKKNIIASVSEVYAEAGSAEFSRGIYAGENFIASDNKVINVQNIASNSYAVSGILAEENVDIDTDNLTITQNGNSTYATGIFAKNSVKIVGITDDSSTVKAMNASEVSNGIMSDANDVTILQSKLNVISGEGGKKTYGIRSSGSNVVIASDSDINVEAKSATDSSSAIWAKGDVMLTEADVDATAGDAASYSGAIRAMYNILASASDITTVSGKSEKSGGLMAVEGRVRTIDTDMNITINNDDAGSSKGIFADKRITLIGITTNSNITISGEGGKAYGLYTNGLEASTKLGGTINLVNVNADITATGSDAAGILASQGNIIDDKADINIKVGIKSKGTNADGIYTRNSFYATPANHIRIETFAGGTGYVSGIRADENVKISGGFIGINGDGNTDSCLASYSAGIYAGQDVLINGVGHNASEGNAIVQAIKAEQNSTGILTVEGTVSIADSYLDVYGSKAGEESYGILASDNNITFVESEVYAWAHDANNKSAGIKAGKNVLASASCIDVQSRDVNGTDGDSIGIEAANGRVGAFNTTFDINTGNAKHRSIGILALNRAIFGYDQSKASDPTYQDYINIEVGKANVLNAGILVNGINSHSDKYGNSSIVLNNMEATITNAGVLDAENVTTIKSYGLLSLATDTDVLINNSALNIDINSITGYAYGIKSGKDVIIKDGTETAINVEHTIKDAYGIYSEESILATNSNLKVELATADGSLYGVYSANENVLIDSKADIRTGEADDNSWGIYASDSIKILDDVTAESGKAENSYALYGANEVIVDAATLNAISGEANDSTAIEGFNAIRVQNNAVVNATAGNSVKYSHALYGNRLYATESVINAYTSDSDYRSYAVSIGYILATKSTISNVAKAGHYSAGIYSESINVYDTAIYALSDNAKGDATGIGLTYGTSQIINSSIVLVASGVNAFGIESGINGSLNTSGSTIDISLDSTGHDNSSYNIGFDIGGNLTALGQGNTINVFSKSSCGDVEGIKVLGKINIENGEINLNGSGTATTSTGIYAFGNIILKNLPNTTIKPVDAFKKSYGIQSGYGNITIDGFELDVIAGNATGTALEKAKGISAENGDVYIRNDAIVNATVVNASESSGIYGYDKVEIEKAAVNVNVSDGEDITGIYSYSKVGIEKAAVNVNVSDSEDITGIEAKSASAEILASDSNVNIKVGDGDEYVFGIRSSDGKFNVYGSNITASVTGSNKDSAAIFAGDIYTNNSKVTAYGSDSTEMSSGLFANNKITFTNKSEINAYSGNGFWSFGIIALDEAIVIDDDSKVNVTASSSNGDYVAGIIACDSLNASNFDTIAIDIRSENNEEAVAIHADNNVEIKNTNKAALNKLTIKETGTATDSYAIRSDKNVILQNLPDDTSIKAMDGIDNSYGIYAEEDITISGFDLDVESGDAGNISAGIYSSASNVTTNEATLSVTTGNAKKILGIKAAKKIDINNSDAKLDVNASNTNVEAFGLYADTLINIAGSYTKVEVDIASGNNIAEAISGSDNVKVVIDAANVFAKSTAKHKSVAVNANVLEIQNDGYLGAVASGNNVNIGIDADEFILNKVCSQYNDRVWPSVFAGAGEAASYSYAIKTEENEFVQGKILAITEAESCDDYGALAGTLSDVSFSDNGYILQRVDKHSRSNVSSLDEARPFAHKNEFAKNSAILAIEKGSVITYKATNSVLYPGIAGTPTVATRLDAVEYKDDYSFYTVLAGSQNKFTLQPAAYTVSASAATADKAMHQQAWATTANCETKIALGSEFPITPYEDVTLYACWDDADVTIKYYDGSSLLKTDVTTYREIKNGTYKSYSYSKSGYTFNSWSISGTEITSGNWGAGVAIADKVSFAHTGTIDYEITATGNWTKNQSSNSGSKSSGGGGGGGGGGGSSKKTSTLGGASGTFSIYWTQNSNGAWIVKKPNGEIVKRAWLCDNAVSANGDNVWYLLNTDGTMLTAGLVQDLTGNFYSLETEHNGYYGMLRYKNGTYTCNGQKVYLEFSQKHDGTFGAVTNADGLAKLKQIYGVTKYGVSNANSVYTKTFQ